MRSHLLAALDKSLDCWCFDIVSDPDFSRGVLTWNRLQARRMPAESRLKRGLAEVCGAELGWKLHRYAGRTVASFLESLKP